MINICESLRCPHALRTGCDQFNVSNYCPVLRVNPCIQANQYWLFADDAAPIDIPQAREVLKTEVLDRESSQRRLWARENMDERQPVMVWEG